MVNPVRLNELSTPFTALKSANQYVEFAIDPSHGLTRKRYGWYSNNTLFDDTFFSNTNTPGAIELSTGTTSTDTARVRSSTAGNYQSHSLAVPGQGLIINDATQDDEGRTFMENGLVAVGAGWHEGGSGGWTVDTNNVKTFIGFKIDKDGMEAVCISDGEHVGESPVKQENWSENSLDGHGRGNDPAFVLKPQNGTIYNEPYTWYNQGAIFVGVVDKERDKFIPCHKFTIDETPSLDRSNLPINIIVDNDGDAASTTVDVGGMQYSRYGSGNISAENRVTPLSRITDGKFVDDLKATNNNSLDATAEPGRPLISYKREADERDTTVDTTNITLETPNDLYIYIFDEFDDANALTGANFRIPNNNQSDLESHLRVDTEATDYTPQTFVFRGVLKFKANDKEASIPASELIDQRVPIDATRIITAVHDGNDTDVDPIIAKPREGY
jgi:hypothetical protein